LATKLKIKKTLRFELTIAFFISFIVSILFTVIFSIWFFQLFNVSPDYSVTFRHVNDRSLSLLNIFLSSSESLVGNHEKEEKITSYITKMEDSSKVSQLRFLILWENGESYLKSDNLTKAEEEDLKELVQGGVLLASKENEKNKHFSYHPVELLKNGQWSKAYILYSYELPPYSKHHILNFLSPTILTILAILISIFMVYILTRGKIKYIDYISQSLMKISKGDLKFRLKEKGHDEIANLAGNINHMAEQLEMMMEHERRSEKMKSELITNISHDLRTPLTSVIGYLRLLKDNKEITGTDTKHYIKVAYERSEKLKQLIDELFFYTKSVNGAIVLKKEFVSINEMLVQLVTEIDCIAKDYGISIQLKLNNDMLMAKVDTLQLSRVFENLIINSIKFSKRPGEVVIASERDGHDFVVNIMNTGNTISKEDLELIFEKYYRIRNADGTEEEGTGLGLAISKSIVLLHGGSIKAECKGNEVRFIVKIPINLES
jgi:signal transduction histidine kinase